MMRWGRLGRHRPALLLIGVFVVPPLACSIAGGEYFGKIPNPDPTHFRWCNSSEPEFIDPGLATATNDMKVAYALFDGLTTHDPEGLPLPSLATHWEISPDQKVFTFHLREDARWSSGRPIIAEDFVYSFSRALHPLTGARNAETLWRIKHAKEYNSGTARLLLYDVGPFRAGEAVEVVPEKGADGKDVMPPSSNLRVATKLLSLHADPTSSSQVNGHVSPGAEVTIVELNSLRDWAYVYSGLGEGVYGWVPMALLHGPHAQRDYRVVAMDDSREQRSASVKGKDILMLPELLGARAEGPLTLVIETVGPTPFLVDLTLQNVFRPVPREAVSRWPKTWTKPGRIVTSGPFHLVAWKERDRLETVKSPTFWGREKVRLEKVTFYSVDDQAASASLYYQGTCDAIVANNVPNSYFPVLSGETGPTKKQKLDYTRAPYLGIYFYLVNTERFPSIHFRRALSYALDRTQLMGIIKGGQIPTAQFTPGKRIADMSDEELALCGVTRDTPGVASVVVRGELCYVPPMGPSLDLELARKELQLAKEELGDKFPKTITIKFNTGVEQHKHIAEWIQHEWERHLGLKVALESQEWKVYLKDTANGEYDIGRMGNIGNSPDPEPDFLSLWRCKAANNRTGWCNREYERLFDQAEVEPDRKKRLLLMQRAEEIMIDEAPIIPLYVYTQHHLRKPYVRGLAINLIDQQSLRETWIDPNWNARGDGK
ncbi:MAG: peptide ABC transporter substrate-binding protein [Deltaproteobacteria bacterium]|nr:peptide ABC transporter substrate-binding protein [Deltaproteobacteria bacterium]